jgi:hypothetical protein
MKRRTKAVIAGSLLLGGVIAFLLTGGPRPSHPAEWKNLRLGMTGDQARAAVPELDGWLRDMKGADFAAADFGNRYWQLKVQYDGGERVSRIERHFVDRRLGLGSRKWVEE